MITYTHSESTSNAVSVNNGKIVTFHYPCESKSSCSPYSLNLKKGTYFLEVFGAQGSNSTACTNIGIGGKGGFSSGIFFADVDLTIFLVVGASSRSSESKAANYGGGGNGKNTNDGPGGGATDFRMNKDDLYSRIIVAGGGGGSFCAGSKTYSGGKGGGLEGSFGENIDGTRPCHGSQTSCTGEINSNGYTLYAGTYGIGAGDYYGGGGGGYWGGGNAPGGGGGGSGYIGAVSGNSKYKRKTVSGVNSGDGWARISYVSFSCGISGRIVFKPSSSLLLYLIIAHY